MLFRSFLGTVLCELAVYFFLLVFSSCPHVSAVAIPPSSLSDASHARKTFTAAPEHPSWSLGARWPDQVSRYPEVFGGSGTVAGLVARETTTGDPSIPTNTPSSTQTTAQTTTFSQPVANPSATFSDPFPPEPLPTEDLDPPPTLPPVPQVDTGVPTWAWGVGGAGIGIVALFGAAKLVSWCARKPAPE